MSPPFAKGGWGDFSRSGQSRSRVRCTSPTVVVSGWNFRVEMTPVLGTALTGKREIPLYPPFAKGGDYP